MKTYLIQLFVIGIFITSCNNNKEKIEVIENDLIEITKAQFEAEKMVFGEPTLNAFTEQIQVTGNVIPTFDGQAQISLTIPGVINKIHCKQGQSIRKGSVMFEVSGSEFIDQQKDFAESSAIISRLKADYLRAKELFNENIATQKDFIAAESNYLAENAKYMALKIKLQYLGLDVSKIEKGEYYTHYTVKSPINGFVSNISISIGQYVDPQQKIAEIIDDNSLQLRLSVFEKNSQKIKIGQTVVFYLNGNKSVKYNAIITAVGKNIMPESKSIECFAVISNLRSVNIVNNQFVEGEVHVSVDSVLSVPETALLKSENDSYLLQYEKEANSIYYFKKIKINTGRKHNDFIELMDNLPSKKILINGVYNIQIE